MSWMSELDLMIQGGARTTEDFMAMGHDPERAEAMAEVAAVAELEEIQKNLAEIRARLKATSEIPLAASSNRADLVFINYAKRDIEYLLKLCEV